jgi:hypothetical protein
MKRVRITTHPGEMLLHECLIPLNMSARACTGAWHPGQPGDGDYRGQAQRNSRHRAQALALFCDER